MKMDLMLPSSIFRPEKRPLVSSRQWWFAMATTRCQVCLKWRDSSISEGESCIATTIGWCKLNPRLSLLIDFSKFSCRKPFNFWHNWNYDSFIKGSPSFSREPGPFENLTVAVLGAAASGTDIGIEISSLAKRVFLCHNNPELPSNLPRNLEQRKGIEKVLEFNF